jgi:hypothetical protein
MRWAGHVAQMGRRGTRRDYWWEKYFRPVKYFHEYEIGTGYRIPHRNCCFFSVPLQDESEEWHTRLFVICLEVDPST